jgi:hypothetical protein
MDDTGHDTLPNTLPDTLPNTLTDTLQDSLARRAALHELDSAASLDAEEDTELRRLHMLKGFGMVAASVVSRYDALRGRDRRRAVRELDDTCIAEPVLREVWGDAAARPASASQRAVGDAGEFFGNSPQPRRGLGVFRR